MNAVDARIGKIDRHALIVNQVTPGRAAFRISLMERPVESRILIGLGSFEFFRSDQPAPD